MVCLECSESFSHTHKLQRYCSDPCRYKAQWRRRSKGRCSGCGEATGYSVGLRDGHLCQPCRRSAVAYRRRDIPSTQTWTCAGCGIGCERPTSRGTVPKWCEACRRAVRNREIKISGVGRFGIYNRDSWTCWLCEEPVDSALIGTKSMWRPSLDHVTPRSLGGTDGHENLRLAHVWCNAARSDGRTYSPEDFRVTK